ncbi:MAG: glycosyltransferase family 4 protein [Anaerolineae bacterium]|nr:glycosyltransferase family 4 protein [Anaerolineae bacterium]
MPSHKPRILILIEHYLPGFLGGGPIRTTVNMVDWLGDEFDFSILTSDCEFGDSTPYPGIEPGNWYQRGKARVRYLAAHERTLPVFRRHLRETPYDLLYLNSVFANSTVYSLLLNRLGQLPGRPIIVAARGNLSVSALNLKARKKQVFLIPAKLFGLYRDVIWDATSEAERQDIMRVFGSDAARRIELVPNLPQTLPHDSQPTPTVKRSGAARIGFLGRVSPMKNLTFALETLRSIQGKVEFDIWGPIEDEAYWQRCRTIIETLPASVNVSLKGAVAPDQVAAVMQGYHLFFLPSLSENFGHVILEALCAGCPVLTSDQTPWKELADHGAGWALPLDNPEAFRQRVQQIVDMDAEAMQDMVNHAARYGRSYIENTPAVEAMRSFLRRLASP